MICDKTRKSRSNTNNLHTDIWFQIIIINKRLNSSIWSRDRTLTSNATPDQRGFESYSKGQVWVNSRAD